MEHPNGPLVISHILCAQMLALKEEENNFEYISYSYAVCKMLLSALSKGHVQNAGSVESCECSLGNQ